MDYSIQDFLLFSPEVYGRLVSGYMGQFFWLAGILNVALFATLPSLKHVNSTRFILLLLVICWVCLGWHFYIIEYGSINWFARYLGALCMLIAPVLIAIILHIRDDNHAVESTLVVSTIVYVVLIRPILINSVGQGWNFSGLGLLPVPTLLATIGIVLSIRFQFRWLLLLVLMLLLLIEVLTLFLVQDGMWQEGPVILAAFLMIAYSGKYRKVVVPG